MTTIIYISITKTYSCGTKFPTHPPPPPPFHNGPSLMSAKLPREPNVSIFFQFDWQTGHNIIFNRPIMGLTPILVHSWGPEQGFRVCFPYKAEGFKFRLRFVFQCGFEAIWACLEICLNLWYKEV